MRLRIYIAQKMTGRSCLEMVEEAEKIVFLFRAHGIDAISPVLDEGIPKIDKPLDYVTRQKLIEEWKLDKKKRLRSCHGIYDVNAELFSEGVSHERGHTRWYLWRKVVRKKAYPYTFSISSIEDDAIVHDDAAAAQYFVETVGTRSKWLRWKLPHLLLGIPKLTWIQLSSLWL